MDRNGLSLNTLDSAVLAKGQQQWNVLQPRAAPSPRQQPNPRPPPLQASRIWSHAPQSPRGASRFPKVSPKASASQLLPPPRSPRPIPASSSHESTPQVAARIEAWIENELSVAGSDTEAQLQVHREALRQLVGCTSGFLHPLLAAIYEEYEARLQHLVAQVQSADALRRKVSAADTESRSVVDRIAKQREAEQHEVEEAEKNVGRLIEQAQHKMAHAQALEQADKEKIKELQGERRSLVEQLKLVGRKTQTLDEEHEAKKRELGEISQDIEVSNGKLKQLQLDCATAVPKDAHSLEIGKLDSMIASKALMVDELSKQLAAKERLLVELTEEIQAH